MDARDLVAVVLLAMVLVGCDRLVLNTSAPPAAEPNSHPTLAPAVPAGARPPATSIPCESSEQVAFHIHAHLAIYRDGAAFQVPYGIGIGQPQRVQDTTVGPFVSGGSCFSWLHTHTGDGVIHIEAPEPRAFTLGEFFGVWGQPLGIAQVGPAQGRVTAYVNGERYSGDSATIPLSAHAVIQLNVGNDSPAPQPYTFANGL